VHDWIRRVGLSEQGGVNELQNAVRAQLDYALEFINEKDFDSARKLLEQVDKNTYDALDSAVASIVIEALHCAKKWTRADFNDHFRHYQDLSGVLIRIARQIKNARQSREQQDALYRDVAKGVDFKDLLRYFDELRCSEKAIDASITKSNKRYRDLIWLSGFGVIATIAAIVIGLVALL